jgi:hypothetical protein
MNSDDIKVEIGLMGMDFASRKISHFFLQNHIPIKWFFAKSNLFLLHFLWALLVRKMMDGRKREREILQRRKWRRSSDRGKRRGQKS